MIERQLFANAPTSVIVVGCVSVNDGADELLGEHTGAAGSEHAEKAARNVADRVHEDLFRWPLREANVVDREYEIVTVARDRDGGDPGAVERDPLKAFAAETLERRDGLRACIRLHRVYDVFVTRRADNHVVDLET